MRRVKPGSEKNDGFPNQLRAIQKKTNALLAELLV